MATLATTAAATIRAEKRAAREQARAEKAAAQALHVIARATFKATNATLYAVCSQDKVYHVTCITGHVSSCIDSATGDACQGWHYTGKCKHAAFVVAFENEHGVLEAKRQDELAVAAQVAPLIVGEQFNSDLQVHAEDEFSAQPELPVVVIDYDKTNAWIIWGNEAVCGRVSDLDYACPGGYQLAGDDGVEKLNAILGCAGESEQARKATEREMYRDMFPDDYGYYGDVA